MNTPNKLTIFRMILIPFFLFFLLTTSIPGSGILALVIFVVASLTDLLDGKIARRYHLVTNFGILMDPLADKMLVMSAIVCFIRVLNVPPVVIVVILAREFLVTSMRLLAAGEGKVIAADKWGKIKTATQMVWIIYGLFLRCILTLIQPYPVLKEIAWGIFWLGMWLSLLATVISGYHYVQGNRALFRD